MRIEPRGPRTSRRWCIKHQGRLWDGKRWVKQCRKPLLYPDSATASGEFPRLELDLAAGAQITLFRIPIEIHIPSAWPLDVDEMTKFLVKKVNYRFDGMDGAPGDVETSFHLLNWSKCQVRQRGRWPDPGTTRPVLIEVPLKVRLLVKGDLDLPKAAEWLKRHVHIDCDELTPGDIPVVVHGVAAMWRRATVLNAPGTKTQGEHH